MTTHKEALEAAYLAGFNASGEGYNGEYPFGDRMQDPAENRAWKKDRDNYIKEALMSLQDGAQPEQSKCKHTKTITRADSDGHPIETTCGECGQCVAQPEQEPMAWMCHPFGDDECEFSDHQECENCIPLYTTPPQRTWVGLTEDEIMDMYNEPRSDAEMIAFGREVEAKLKEKNT